MQNRFHTQNKLKVKNTSSNLFKITIEGIILACKEDSFRYIFKKKFFRVAALTHTHSDNRR